MKLTSIQVENFRSIIKTQVLILGRHLTSIIGPNNEGRSNLLRAIVLAMECLRGFRGASDLGLRVTESGIMRLQRNTYDWQNDFPQGLQAKYPDGHTTLTLTFELSVSERDTFKKACGNAINNDLPIQIEIGLKGARFRVRKPGRGAKSYERSSIKIARFISENFEFEYIPAIRPGQMSLEIVGNLLERELAVLAEDEKYKESIKIIDQLQGPVYEQLEVNVQAQLRKLLPSVKRVKIVPSKRPQYNSPRFRTPELIIDDGTATSLESKGDGIKSLTAISLMRASQAANKAGGLVVAIEEPESHLHPGAIRQLANVLQEMSREHQVIITTHSPLLVTRNNIRSNIIVSQSFAKPALTIKALRDTLGVRVEDNLASAEYVILVEGKTDVAILSAIFANINESFNLQILNGKIVFDDLQGAGNIGYKLSTLSQAVTTQILITDDDKAGRDADKKAGTAGLSEKYRFAWRRPPEYFTSTEFEDMLDPEFYWNKIKGEFGVNLDLQLFESRRDSWSDRMRIVYEHGGKRWSSIVESKMKEQIALMVTENPPGCLFSKYKGIVYNNVEGIVGIMDSA
jgi:putative ATP-dependent endonuclease of OLD family